MKAEAQYEASKAKYDAALIESQAEMSNIEGLSAIRKHELAMARAEVLQDIAKKSSIVLGGAAGEDLLKSLIGS